MAEEELGLVFEGKSVDAEFVKNLLNDSGINCFLRDKYMGHLFTQILTQVGRHPVKVFVFQKDLTEAKKLVSNYLGL